MVAKSSIKRAPKKKVAILHHCSEADRISKIELILVGNGHPEDGYVFKVVEMGREVKEINEKLTGISGIVKELHEESVGIKAVVKTIREKRTEWVKIAMFIIGAIALCFTAWNSFKNIQNITKIDTKIETMGVPIVTRNGKFLALPDSTQIQFFANDSLKYTIKRDK